MKYEIESAGGWENARWRIFWVESGFNEGTGSSN